MARHKVILGGGGGEGNRKTKKVGPDRENSQSRTSSVPKGRGQVHHWFIMSTYRLLIGFFFPPALAPPGGGGGVPAPLEEGADEPGRIGGCAAGGWLGSARFERARGKGGARPGGGVSPFSLIGGVDGGGLPMDANDADEEIGWPWFITGSTEPRRIGGNEFAPRFCVDGEVVCARGGGGGAAAAGAALPTCYE